MRFIPRQPKDGINISKTHPLKELLYLISVVVGGFIIIVIACYIFIDLLVPFVPVKYEQKAFKGMEKLFTLALDSNDNSTMKEKEILDKLIDDISVHWKDNPYSFDVIVVLDIIPNAFAIPGGTIAVTSGLLSTAKSENELVFVLGHEMGHFANRDHLTRLSRSLLMTLVFSMIGIQSDTSSDMMEAVEQITDQAHSREQERNADEFGLDIVVKKYGHIDGALTFFKHMPKTSGKMKPITKYFATHPMDQERIKDLTNYAKDKGWKLKGDITPFDVFE